MTVTTAALKCLMITLAVLNIVPSEPEIGGSIPGTSINLAYLLGIMPIADLIC
jgi:hypothetical protein